MPIITTQIMRGTKVRIIAMNKYSLLLLLSLVTQPAFADNITVLGQGLHPAPVIYGDSVPPPPVPTGSNNDINSSVFPASPERTALTINLLTGTYSHNTKQYMGKRVVLTFKTNILNAMQMDLISGILQVDLNSGPANENNLSIDVNEDQLEQIQNVLVPATYSQENPKQTWLFHYLPIVRKWCCWAVGLGVVFATVMLALAAYGIVMSHRGSADKVISTVAGLAVLLMAYTIYSLLVTNLSNHQLLNQTITPSPLQ
jgi:hypothetical protein